MQRMGSASRSTPPTSQYNPTLTEQRLVNEVFLIKASFCRVSKRVRLIEQFLKSKFNVREFTFGKSRSSGYEYPSPALFQLKALPSSSDPKESEIRDRKGHHLFDPGQHHGDVGGDAAAFDLQSDVIFYDETSTNSSINYQDKEETANLRPNLRPRTSLRSAGISEKTDKTEDNASAGPPYADIIDQEYCNPASVTQEVDSFMDDDDIEPKSPNYIPSNEESDSDEDVEDPLDVDFGKGGRRGQESNSVCEVCGKMFSGRDPVRYLKVHMNTVHADVKDHKCSTCDKAFATAPLRNRHEKRAHQVSSEDCKCTICGRIFTGEDPARYLQEHILTVHSEKKYKCSQCEAVFGLKRVRDRHERKHAVRFSCVFECKQSYIVKESLEIHYKKREEEGSCPPVRILQQPAVLVCPVCNKSFSGTRRRNYKEHLRIHNPEKLCKCTICDRSFCMPKRLNKHMKIHTRETASEGKDLQEVCDVCGKVFKGLYSSNNFKMHMQIHANKRSFVCSYCGKGFNQQKPMRAHVKLVHEKEEHSKYGCTYCEMKFTKRGHLKRHLVVHTGERPYLCDICGWSTADKSSLRKHKAHHRQDGADRVDCPECDRFFFHKSLLRIHQKRVHESRRGLTGPDTVKCKQCSSKFSSLIKMKIHATKVHGSTSNRTSTMLGINRKTKTDIKIKRPVSTPKVPKLVLKRERD